MPPTPKGRRTEAAFLDAARRVFAEKGYFNAKISDIAQAAGKSSGSFYNYYENKEELLQALLDQFSSEVLVKSFQNQGDDPEEGIRAAARVYWHTYREYLAEMIGMFQMSMTDESFNARWREVRSAGVRAVLAGIHAAEQAGYRHGPRPDLLASAIAAMIDSFCWTWLATGGEPDMPTPTDEEAIEAIATVWYRSVYYDPVPRA
ncbi:TetR family transcriptional regulator [Actinocorallia herbida]|uniref:TetR family transcriptional regulator n=1 Tax=Actinocorallia herbida TaxID=58109 RepID=A0A3N1D950_9ACTN|nr:TetR/AcrR family transcriptional regulator [Actinocorallia herbida]ROO90016.1 TetR family transcriptional regulator [Actinocorallia herbida]